MKYVDKSKPVDIALSAVTCPDCGRGLWVEITEWGTEGDVTEGGFDIHCKNEDRKPKLHAERWQDWIPVEAKVYQWLLDNVRVADATEDDLKRWNENVKDFASNPIAVAQKGKASPKVGLSVSVTRGQRLQKCSDGANN